MAFEHGIFVVDLFTQSGDFPEFFCMFTRRYFPYIHIHIHTGYIYIYVCMYVCIHIYTYIDIYIYIFSPIGPIFLLGPGNLRPRLPDLPSGWHRDVEESHRGRIAETVGGRAKPTVPSGGAPLVINGL